MKGFEYFDNATLQEYFNGSTSNVAACLGIPTPPKAGIRTDGRHRSLEGSETRLWLPQILSHSVLQAQDVTARPTAKTV